MGRVVRHQGLEPRTNGLRVQWKPFIHAGFTVHVHQDVAGWEKFRFFCVLSSNDAGFDGKVGETSVLISLT
jgi:hypothetical protein